MQAIEVTVNSPLLNQEDGTHRYEQVCQDPHPQVLCSMLVSVSLIVLIHKYIGKHSMKKIVNVGPCITDLFSLLALMVYPRLWFVCYAQHSNRALFCNPYEAPNCRLSMQLNEQTGMVMLILYLLGG